MGATKNTCPAGSKAGLRIRFSRDLDFFLSRDRRTALCCDLTRRASAKDLIESLGVPHTEVGTIRYQGEERDFGFIPEAPGTMEVSGISSPFDLLAGDRLRPIPLQTLKFVADLNVGKLGRYLLLLGYDTVLARDESDARIAGLAASQNRVVLTRDTRLLFRRSITFARRIRSGRPLAQLVEVISFFGLRPDPALFFSRCAACNRLLEPVEKAAVWHRLEPKTRAYVHTFRQCSGCGQVYWEGSHHAALQRRFRELGILDPL